MAFDLKLYGDDDDDDDDDDDEDEDEDDDPRELEEVPTPKRDNVMPAGEARLYLDGRWTTDDFVAFFQSLTDLYRLVELATSDEIPFGSPSDSGDFFSSTELERLSLLREMEPLQVARISYASPGLVALMGDAKTLLEVVSLVFGLANRIPAWRGRNDKIDLATKELSFIQQLREQLEKSGASEGQLAEFNVHVYSRLESLVSLVASGKLLPKPHPDLSTELDTRLRDD